MPKTVVYYDIDTCGLDSSSDILQIAAVSSCGETFSQYVRPISKWVDEEATQVNGLTIDSHGNLLKDGKAVPTVCLTQALQDFCDFLEDLNADCLLVAHNGHSFDHLFLSDAVLKTQLDDRLEESVCGFADTLPVLRSYLGSHTSLRLCHLARNVLEQDYLYDSLSKAQALKDILRRLRIPETELYGTSRWFL